MADNGEVQQNRLHEERPPTGIAYQIPGRNDEDSTHRPLVGAVAGVPNRALNPQLPPQLVGRIPNIIPALEQLNPTQQPSYNWQATKTTLKERFQYLFNNETRSDVHFVVGRGVTSQRIPAHKFVLSVGSAVFDAMFNSILATQSEDVDLPDVEPAAFLSLLKFLYTDEVNIGPETVMTTLYTAKKYAVPALEAQCVDFLKKNLNSDNAFMLLTQARLFDEPQLAKMCLQCIDKYTKEALAADGFTDIDYSTLIMFLQRDTLGLREVYIFSAVERWSDVECNRQEMEATKENKRKVIGDALYSVRFPLMSIEEFAQGPAQSGILTDREVIDLFLYFTLNPKPRVRFSDKSRCSLTGKEQSVCRFREVAERWGYSGTSDRIKFSVDAKIFVVGFGLYGAIQGAADYQVSIQIVTCDNSTVLAQNDTGFSCDGSNKTYRVMFKQPVEIKPNTSYIASATINGHDSYYGTRGQRRMTKDQSNQAQTVFTFHFAPGNNNGTTVEDGQIPEIIYYQ